MDKFFALIPYLRRIFDPKPYRTIVAWILRISALLIPIAFIAISVNLWMTLKGRANVEMVMFCLVFTIILAAWLYTIANILWLRAGQIATPAGTDDYPITLIVVDLIRITGENLAATLAFAGLSSFIGGMFPTAGQMLSAILPLGGGAGFLMGLVGFATLAVLAFLVLLVFYGIAELCRISVDIANNTKRIASR